MYSTQNYDIGNVLGSIIQEVSTHNHDIDIHARSHFIRITSYTHTHTHTHIHMYMYSTAGDFRWWNVNKFGVLIATCQNKTKSLCTCSCT